MRVKTTQEPTFADSFINILNSQLDTINKIINWELIAKQLAHIKVDYSAISLFKALLIGTWHNLSDEKLFDSLLNSINTMLESHQLKLANGKHVAMDATLIQSSRCAKVNSK